MIKSFRKKPEPRIVKRIYRGMFRPKWEIIWKQVEEQISNAEPSHDQPIWIQCKCKAFIFSTEARDHWQLGHFDEPVYQDIEEK